MPWRRSPRRNPPKKAPTASATLTPDQREAQKHYRIALEAIKNNDFTTASDELTAASKLAPKNALIWYNLAVVESKKGDSAQSALDHLQKATSLGLPKTLTNDADDLEAKLSYDVKREAKKQALSATLLELQREIKDLSGGKCYATQPERPNEGYFAEESFSYVLFQNTGSLSKLRIRFTEWHSMRSSIIGSTSTCGQGELEFDLADLNSATTVDNYQGLCSTAQYRLAMDTNRRQGVYVSGNWQQENSGTGHKEGAYSDSDGFTLVFQNKDSADKVARTFSELIQMSASMNQVSTDKR